MNQVLSFTKTVTVYCSQAQNRLQRNKTVPNFVKSKV